MPKARLEGIDLPNKVPSSYIVIVHQSPTAGATSMDTN